VEGDKEREGKGCVYSGEGEDAGGRACVCCLIMLPFSSSSITSSESNTTKTRLNQPSERGKRKEMRGRKEGKQKSGREKKGLVPQSCNGLCL